MKTKNDMQIINPEIPIYELYIEENKIASLYEPKYEDMFWCSYRLEPVSDKFNKTLRDKKIWNDVKFTIKAPDGSIPNPNTFGGGAKDFCDGKTDRMSFRSLWPPKSRIAKDKRKSLFQITSVR